MKCVALLLFAVALWCAAGQGFAQDEQDVPVEPPPAVMEDDEKAVGDAAGVDGEQAERAAQLLAAMAAEEGLDSDSEQHALLRQAREDLRAALFALRTAQAELDRELHAEAGESFLTAHLLVKGIDPELKPLLERELTALDHRFVALARGMLKSTYLEVEDSDEDESESEQSQAQDHVTADPEYLADAADTADQAASTPAAASEEAADQADPAADTEE